MLVKFWVTEELLGLVAAYLGQLRSVFVLYFLRDNHCLDLLDEVVGARFADGGRLGFLDHATRPSCLSGGE